MSHFAVLVIGDHVDQQLAPYHEYECTGREDEYVVDVDVTEELESELDEDYEAVKRPDGSLTSRFASEFYTKDNGETDFFGKPKLAFELPVGAEIVKMKQREFLSATGESIPGFAREYGGWVERDGRFFKRTNPNAKWDWYEIGGRWTGWMKLKAGANGELGRPGIMTPPAESGTADIMRKSDIDFDGMRDDAGREAAKKWDKAKSITSDLWESWEAVRGRVKSIDKAREFYRSQPGVKALKESRDEDFSWEVDDRLAGPREDFIERARNRACIPYAIVMNGKWVAKGEMGWWGCSNDAISEDEWNKQVSDVIDALPDYTRITVIDCHI